MNIEILPWIVAAAALAATVMNIRKDRRCFLIWAGTNTYWMIYDAINGLYAQAMLFAVYLMLALVGLRKWRDTDYAK